MSTLLEQAREAQRAHARVSEEIDERPAAFDKRASIDAARALLAPSIRTAIEYPSHALGPMADACRAIATDGQLESAMAGQCLLSAASLLTQGLWNVRTLAGVKPLSIFAQTLADSGDGKSTAESATLHPVREWQREQNRDFRLACALAEKDKAPPAPHRLVKDPTVEGLRRDLDTGPVSQGIFSSEGAAMLTGYGMSAEHRTKTAAVLSSLWDDGHLSVSRATGGRVERYGTRLAAHLLIQPSIASEVLGDPALSAIGLWPRFLLAWPAPSAPRVARPFDPGSIPAVGRYWKRCADLLGMELPDDATDCPVIVADTEAHAVMRSAFERFEREGKLGSLTAVKPFALRGAEQMHRVAAVLAAFAGRQVITAEDARNALALVLYSLESWRAVIDGGAADPTARHALRLYEWLLDKPGLGVEAAQVTRIGPACVRSKDSRDAAIGMLLDHGLACRVGSMLVAHVKGG